MVLKIDSISSVLDDNPFYGDLAPDPATITGLTFGFTAGHFVDATSATVIAAGTLVLADDAVSIVHRLGAVMADDLEGSEAEEVNRLYRITTASGAITVIEDLRGYYS